MSQLPADVTPAPIAPSTRQAAVVTSLIALVVGILELISAGVMWYLTDIDPTDDPLVGLGYLVALLMGVPGVVAVVLGGLGWLLAGRTAGLVLAILATVAASGPVMIFLLSWSFAF